MDGLDKNDCCVACGEVMILARATFQVVNSLFLWHFFFNGKGSSDLKCILWIGLGPINSALILRFAGAHQVGWS